MSSPHEAIKEARAQRDREIAATREALENYIKGYGILRDALLSIRGWSAAGFAGNDDSELATVNTSCAGALDAAETIVSVNDGDAPDAKEWPCCASCGLPLETADSKQGSCLTCGNSIR